MSEALPFLMFAALLVLLLLGFPVAFTIAGTALLFAWLGHLNEVFWLSDLGFIPARIFGVMNNFTLVAVPLFIFMGTILESSGVATNLLKTVAKVMRGFRGSLATAVVIVGTILAASTGIVGATVVTMGVLALPAMLDAGYDKRVASGVIAASGTLGQIIPPSIVLVLLGDIMSLDVGALFIGAVIPSALLVASYLLYVSVLARKSPHLFEQTTAIDRDEPLDLRELIHSLVAPAALIIIVLGSILTGLASPTEAAGCGATGALLISGWRRQRLRWAQLKDAMTRTAEITAMVFMILIAAQFFGMVFRGLEGDRLLIEWIETIALDRRFILLFLMVLLFLLGFFLDFLEICFIVIPIVLPVMESLGFDKLWLAVLIALNLQTSFLTPPFGFALFYLKGACRDRLETREIYQGVVPFIGLQLLVMTAVILWPPLIWRP